jgi:hypothetical protein
VESLRSILNLNHCVTEAYMVHLGISIEYGVLLVSEEMLPYKFVSYNHVAHLRDTFFSQLTQSEFFSQGESVYWTASVILGQSVAASVARQHPPHGLRVHLYQ